MPPVRHDHLGIIGRVSSQDVSGDTRRAPPWTPDRDLEDGPKPTADEVMPVLAVQTERLARRLTGPLGPLWDRGFRLLIALDAVALFLSMVVITTARFGRHWPSHPLSHYLTGFAIATVIHLVVNYFAGLYEREPRLGARPWLGRVLVATAP